MESDQELNTMKKRHRHNRQTHCKKSKLMNITKFEDLPNELCLNHIFISFDFYSLYFTFYGINSRYNQLVVSCNKLKLNMKLIPVSESVSFIYHVGNLFPKGSVLSIQSEDNNQIGFLTNDNIFQNLIGNIKSLTLRGNILINNIQKFLSIESLHRTLQYLNLQNIKLKECYSDHCSSEGCFREVSDDWDYLQSVIRLALIEMRKLKIFRISFYNEEYPAHRSLEGLFEEAKWNRYCSQRSNISKLNQFSISYMSFSDFIDFHEICPKLEYLQMQTDYNDNKLDIPASTEKQYPNITNLCLMVRRYCSQEINIKKIEHLVSYFPKLSILKVDKSRMKVKEEEWNNLVLNTSINIVAMTNQHWKYMYANY